MTELEVRQSVCDKINSWVGAKQYDATHKQIIDIYNSHTPYARGYKMTYNDYWCATTVSAVAIALGYTDIMPTECGCISMRNLYKKLGRWVEDDSYVAKIGDLIEYYWADTGYGDCPSDNADHIGIITEVHKDYYIVTEGNMGAGIVGKRKVTINGRYICGFCTPDYAKKAKELTEKATRKVDYYVQVKHITRIALRIEPAYKVKILAKIKNKTKLHIVKQYNNFGYCTYGSVRGWIDLGYTKKVAK